MKKRGVIVLRVMILVIIMVASIWLMLPKEVSWEIRWGSVAKRELKRFKIPKEAKNISPITVQQADGTLPEIATETFVMDLDNKPSFLNALYQQCAQFEMEKPDKETIELEPETLCVRRGPKDNIQFLMYFICESEMCVVTLEMRSLPI